MKYKTELHCHTKEISPCSEEPGADVAAKYIEHGYTTLTVTNHFTCWILEHYCEGNTWKEKVDFFFDAIDRVREAAGEKLTVLDGLELHLANDPNDYLVFGAGREAFYDAPGIFEQSIKDAHEYLNSLGAIVIQAHPFRFGMKLTHPSHVDGYEIANGHPGHYSHNDLAETWARRFVNHHPIMTAGTDEHQVDHRPNAGILTDEPIKTVDELLETLRSGNYELIRPVLDQDPNL